MHGEARQNAKKQLTSIAAELARLQELAATDKPCADLLAQVAVVRKLVDDLALLCVCTHVEACVLKHGADAGGCLPIAPEEPSKEIRRVIRRYLRPGSAPGRR